MSMDKIGGPQREKKRDMKSELNWIKLSLAPSKFDKSNFYSFNRRLLIEKLQMKMEMKWSVVARNYLNVSNLPKLKLDEMADQPIFSINRCYFWYTHTQQRVNGIRWAMIDTVILLMKMSELLIRFRDEGSYFLTKFRQKSINFNMKWTNKSELSEWFFFVCSILRPLLCN